MTVHVRAIILIIEHDHAELIKTEASPCCQVSFHIAALFLIRWLNCHQLVLSDLISIFPLSTWHSVSPTEKYRDDFFFFLISLAFFHAYFLGFSAVFLLFCFCFVCLFINLGYLDLNSIFTFSVYLSCSRMAFWT